ncbi:teashirt homolog 1-like [Periophthalmus magnuspinnatus]|uniref:teashirt homolog 1-like n=1 Tax=Periophthalmus magnuspinnatus TaxID=409849 RepID=UPI00145AC19B|nr:teashirt homolog 1-like [Periophthalmus magnuspinnatus]XP_055083557.1 teashirt homolog 1-like [Periophthalmus magnuspinnatus]
MPRRKQQEPRRSAAYMPEDELKAAPHDEEEHLQDDGLSLDGQDTEFMCNEEDDDLDGGQLPSYRDSPLSNGTNPDAGYGSPLSDSSDRLADFKSTSSRDGQERDGNALRPNGNNGLSIQDSLAKMKAVYANLISDASWSSITLDIMKSKSAAAGSVNSALTATATAPVSPTSPANKSSGTSVVSSQHNGKSSGSVNHSSNSTCTTNGIAVSTASTHSATSSSGSSSGAASNGSGVAYDWHQAALAKTLQQTPYHLLPEPSLFSTVQLYRQNNKLYGSVFTGASKFRCKDCSAAYDTLVGLTVHMNETGHYRDDNKDKEEEQGKRWSKPRKRSLMEMEGKEDAQKVLKCMYCGHSFESLQDLSVHMIKTKHYQKVPLKEPVPALATKLVPTSAKKRAIQDPIVSPCSPDSVHAVSGGGSISLSDAGKDSKSAANPYVTPNNRYGYQNGASYTWQFEARKAQILKCMECGSSHDTLQQLTAHMMVTGHFLKVTNSASKKGKQLVFDPVVEEKIQSIPLPPTTTRLPVPCGIKSQPVSPALSSASEEKREGPEEEKVDGDIVEKKIKEEKEDSGEKSESDTTSYKYLREEDLEETPKGGLDILKSLENTVSSAISKAQTGTPTWGGYPSIHAAYQLQGAMKSSTTVLPPTIQSVQMQPMFNSSLRGLVNDPNSVIHSPRSPSSPTPLRSNVTAMEELVEKVTGKAATVKKEKEEKMVSLERCRPPSLVKSPSPAMREQREQLPSPNDLSVGKPSGVRSSSPGSVDSELICKKEPKESLVDSHSNHSKNGSETCQSPVTNGNSLGIITDHSPESPFVNPLSALQSIMNTHLGKASKPVSPAADPLSMLYKISNSMIDKPAFNPSSQGKSTEPISHYQLYESSDQPIDLSKNKSTNTSNSNNNNNSCVLQTNNSVNGNKPIMSLSESVSSPLRENALMDISDMVKNLTGRLTPKSSTPSSISEKSDAEGSAFEDAMEDLSPVQKRKGRQSNWNPQHLLILQAQFASSLRETPEGRYAMTDLGPQERVHICKFTGLSMTTISHWLANVKYQLRRTGGTKFLKNMDSCQPVFLCGDCASQFRTPASYISHLESHLGFSLKDLSKLSSEHLREQQAASKVITDKLTFSTPLSLTTVEDEAGSVYQCRLCNRTFVSKHAVKLHLSKTHGKSPEDHLVFVSALEKLEKLDKIEKVQV